MSNRTRKKEQRKYFEQVKTEFENFIKENHQKIMNSYLNEYKINNVKIAKEIYKRSK